MKGQVLSKGRVAWSESRETPGLGPGYRWRLGESLGACLCPRGRLVPTGLPVKDLGQQICSVKDPGRKYIWLCGPDGLWVLLNAADVARKQP